MKNNVILKHLLDYLNDIRSKVIIEYFDKESGIISLSNNNTVNIAELQEPEDIVTYL